MTTYSLRLRLLAGAAVAIFVALVVAWFGMTVLFKIHIDRRVEGDLKRSAVQIVAGLHADANGSILVLHPPVDPRFAVPASGVYWQVSTAKATKRSRSLWDQALPMQTSADRREWHSRLATGPFGQRILLVERQIVPDRDGMPVLVQLAHEEQTLKLAQSEFGRDLAAFLVLLWVLLAVASWIQVQLGLRPLGILRKSLTVLRHNPSERLTARLPREIEPLVEAINALADTREIDVRRARQRAADLAHALKTPLSALSAQTRLLGSRHGADTSGMERAIASAGAAVEAELARARAAASRLSVPVTVISPLAIIEQLVAVLDKTDKGMRLDYDLDLPQGLVLPVAAEDLREILGPLLENAVRFARRQVRIGGDADTARMLLTIEDDGPGIATDRMASAMTRGKRLDETDGGHGLGLAIAREMTEATGGSIGLETSSLGGLRVELNWLHADTVRPRSAKLTKHLDAITNGNAP